MSYLKKSAHLQELQQAIKKKITEKSRNKEQVSKLLLCSVEKKRKDVGRITKDKTCAFEKEKEGQEGNYRHQGHQGIVKIDNIDKPPLSIFKNENLVTIESKDLVIQKHNNRKFNKLISLINYLVSSSEKLSKHIHSSNFDAQFALKLYKSDKQNLVNELTHFSFADIGESQRANDCSQISQHNCVFLEQENSKLKKQILVLEQQVERFHQIRSTEKQHTQKYSLLITEDSRTEKYKEFLQKTMPFELYTEIVQAIEKQWKLQSMASKCLQNKKISDIESMIQAQAKERHRLMQKTKQLKQSKNTTHREHNAIKEIQQERAALEKEIALMHKKMTQCGEISNLIYDNEQLKKNHNANWYALARILGQDLSTKKNGAIQMGNYGLLLQKITQKIESEKSLKEELRKEEERKLQQSQILKIKHEEQQKQYQQLLEQLQELQTKKNIAEKQMAKYHDYFKGCRTSLEKKQSEIVALKTEINNTKEQITRIEAMHCSEVKRQQIIIQNLNESILQLINENNKLRQECQKRIRRQQSEQLKHLNLKIQHQRLIEQNEFGNKNLTDITAQLQNMRSTMNNLQENIKSESLISKVDSVCKNCEKQNQRSQNIEFKDKNIYQSKQIDAKSDQSNKRVAKVNVIVGTDERYLYLQASNQCNILGIQDDEQESPSQIKSINNLELAELRKNIEKLESQNEIYRLKIEQQQKEYEKVEIQNIYLESCAAKNGELSEQIVRLKLDYELAIQQSKKNITESQQQRLKQNSYLETLEKQLNEMEAQLKYCKSKTDELLNQQQLRKSQLLQSLQNLVICQQKLKGSEALNKQQQNEILILTSNCGRFQRIIEQKCQYILSLSELIKQNEEQIKGNLIQLRQLQSRILQYQEKQQIICSDNQDRFKLQQNQIFQLNLVIQKYEKNLHYYQERTQQIQRKNSQLYLASQQTQKQLSEWKLKHEEIRRKTLIYENTIQEMQRQQRNSQQLQEIIQQYKDHLKNTRQNMEEIKSKHKESELVAQEALSVMTKEKQCLIESNEKLTKRIITLENIQHQTKQIETYYSQLQINFQKVSADLQKIHEQTQLLKEQCSSKAFENDKLLTQLSHSLKEKQVLQTQLNEVRSISESKQQQYVYLLKQILKKIVKWESLLDVNDIEGLLQIGVQKVLQMRKREREQESVRRKHQISNLQSDEYYEHELISEFDSEEQNGCQKRLFYKDNDIVEAKNNNVAENSDGKGKFVVEQNEKNNQIITEKGLMTPEQLEQQQHKIQDKKESLISSKNKTEQNSSKLDFDKFDQYKQNTDNSFVSIQNSFRNEIKEAENKQKQADKSQSKVDIQIDDFTYNNESNVNRSVISASNVQQNNQNEVKLDDFDECELLSLNQSAISHGEASSIIGEEDKQAMKHMEEIINMKNNEEPDSFLANLEEFEDQRVSNLDNSMTSEN